MKDTSSERNRLRPDPALVGLVVGYETIGDCYYCDSQLDPRYDYFCNVCEKQSCDSCKQACIDCDEITCARCIEVHVGMAHPELE